MGSNQTGVAQFVWILMLYYRVKGLLVHEAQKYNWISWVIWCHVLYMPDEQSMTVSVLRHNNEHNESAVYSVPKVHNRQLRLVRHKSEIHAKKYSSPEERHAARLVSKQRHYTRCERWFTIM